MEEDQAAFREAFARPFEPPLFAGPFGPPRDARVTGQYGERRIFNGKKQSQHYGTDLAGAVGDPVLATNDGVVVLVRDCFASGKSVAIAHGGGLFSVYFHLSDFDVRHRRPGPPRPAHRQGRRHRPRHRPAPALRDQGGRPLRRPRLRLPARLRVARARPRRRARPPRPAP